MPRILIFLAALLAFAAPARADDVSAAARSVVRVVVVAVEDGRVVGFGHGSGFAVAPNRIVTNAHVVALAARYPDNVVIGVVPSEGSKSYGAELVAFDPGRDLALLEMREGTVPPATLFTGNLPEGSDVVALGYPGNVDLATAQSSEDYITPQAPTRSNGNYSNARQINGIDALLHTANIARGNSGGPLLDPCGRVVGVNTFITRGDDGDSPFAFAVANSALASFLGDAKQRFAAVSGGCVPIAERLGAEKARRERERQSAEARTKAARDEAERLALTRAVAANEDARENRLAIAIALGLLGLAGFGGAGLMAHKDRMRPAAILAGAGAVLVIGGALVFLTRPARGDLHVDPVAVPANGTAAAEKFGRSVCRLVAERSRVTVSPTADVEIDWQAGGCMNGRTQYARAGNVWRRVLVPAGEATVSVVEYTPSANEYVVTRYLMPAAAMAEARRLRASVNIKACGKDSDALAILGDRQETIRASLPELPNERLVYECDPN